MHFLRRPPPPPPFPLQLGTKEYYYQVVLQGIQGVFHKFFKMLKDECSVLDIKIAELAEKEECPRNENFHWIGRKNVMYRNKYCKLSDEIQFLNDAIHIQILHNSENEMLPRNLYARHLEELHKELQDKVYLFNSFFFW